MKTAMQEVIIKMQEAKDNFPNIGFDEEFIRGFNKAFQMAIFIVEKVGIDKEKQQIINACNQTEFEDIDGMGIHETITRGEQYYNETFKKKKMKKEKVLLQSSIDGEPIWGYEEDVICVYVEDKNQSNNYCSNCGKQMWQHKTPKNYIKNYINK